LARTFARSRGVVKTRAFDNPRRSFYDPRAVTGLLRALHLLPHVVVTTLMIVAMADMLVGVFLRYVMTWVSATFDLPSIRFFWVEEVGEYALAWLTFIGAAIGIRRGTHFAVHILTDRLPAGMRQALAIGHAVLLMAFGALLAVYGWQVSELNSQSYSPGLDLNLRWLYLSSVVGGVHSTFYTAAALRDALRNAPGPAIEG
jgi:TRAP-type C4-dicarboxylate transport system permease small subunit